MYKCEKCGSTSIKIEKAATNVYVQDIRGELDLVDCYELDDQEYELECQNCMASPEYSEDWNDERENEGGAEGGEEEEE